MTKNESTNNRIAKNTLLLYIRMFVTMAIGLYTSRIVLQTLGVNDYGIYNVVGGFVAVLAYANSVFVSATQRFLSFSLGKNRKEDVSRVFSTAVTVHYILGVIVLLLAETLGLWFVNTQLNIDEGRMVAANWVYQCAVISLFLNIVSVPYNSSIIANEHMDFFAYVSIFEALAKLGAVYMLCVLPFDKLIINAVLWALIAIVVRYVYIIYCKKKFPECSYHFIWDKSLLKKMSSYAGWTAVGTLGFTFKEQFFNILLNIFLGTAINAARGIAMQVSGIVNQFASNFFMAVQPQITKQYASGQIDRSRKLVYSSAKLVVCLLSMVAIPLILNLDYLLELWLVKVPQYTCEFLVIILVSTLIGSFASPVTTAIQATGNIRNFQIGVAIIFLLELPIAYILLSNGYEPYLAATPALATQAIAVIYRFFILHRLVDGYSSIRYFINVVARTAAIIGISFVINYAIHSQFSQSFMLLVWSSLLSAIITGVLVYSFVVSREERMMINGMIAKVLHKK